MRSMRFAKNSMRFAGIGLAVLVLGCTETVIPTPGPVTILGPARPDGAPAPIHTDLDFAEPVTQLQEHEQKIADLSGIVKELDHRLKAVESVASVNRKDSSPE